MMLLSPPVGPYFPWELVGWEIILAVISRRRRGILLAVICGRRGNVLLAVIS